MSMTQLAIVIKPAAKGAIGSAMRNSESTGSQNVNPFAETLDHALQSTPESAQSPAGSFPATEGDTATMNATRPLSPAQAQLNAEIAQLLAKNGVSGNRKGLVSTTTQDNILQNVNDNSPLPLTGLTNKGKTGAAGSMLKVIGSTEKNDTADSSKESTSAGAGIAASADAGNISMTVLPLLFIPGLSLMKSSSAAVTGQNQTAAVSGIQKATEGSSPLQSWTSLPLVQDGAVAAEQPLDGEQRATPLAAMSGLQSTAALLEQQGDITITPFNIQAVINPETQQGMRQNMISAETKQANTGQTLFAVQTKAKNNIAQGTLPGGILSQTQPANADESLLTLQSDVNADSNAAVPLSSSGVFTALVTDNDPAIARMPLNQGTALSAGKLQKAREISGRADSQNPTATVMTKADNAVNIFAHTAREGREEFADHSMSQTPLMPTGNDDGLEKSDAVQSAGFQGILDNRLTGATLAPAVQETAAPQADHSQSDPYNIAGQIVEQAKLINRDQSSEMIIHLKPEHLGELTLKVSVENGSVSASFHSNNPEVRGLIESSLPQLRQDLSSQGIKLDNVSVYSGLSQFFSDGQQRETLQQQQVLKNQPRKIKEDFDQAVDAIENQSLSSATAGVDYRI